MATNVYELHGRAAKVARIVAALDAYFGHAATAEEAAALPAEAWGQILRAANASGERAPSGRTAIALAEELRRREVPHV